MVYPYPAPEAEDRKLFTYTNRRRIVEIWADSQAEADLKFEERFGFTPTKEHKNA